MREEFESLERGLELARECGATSCELLMQSSSEFAVKVFGGRVENFVSSLVRGVGVRAFKGNRCGRSYTSGIDPGDLEEAVGRAVENAEGSPEDPSSSLPKGELSPEGAGDADYLGEDLRIYSPALADVPPEEKIGVAKRMEEAARSHDPRVTGVESSWYVEGITDVLLVNSQGFRAGYRTSECYGYLIVLAEDAGETQTGFYFTAGKGFDELDPDAAAAEAAERAVGMLGGRKVKSRESAVVLDNLVAAEFVGLLGVALSGEMVTRGRSFLVGRKGQRVGSDAVVLVDDGLRVGGFGTAPFDAEGVVGTRKELISGGVLEGYLHNSSTAARVGEETTGNASRGSYRDRVTVSPTNLFLEPGDMSPGGIRQKVGDGFLVTEIQGVHVGLNPITGEISVGARGWWLEGGEPAYPVREVTIAGDMLSLLASVTMVGDDLLFIPLLGGIGAPTVAVDHLVLSGA